MSKRIKQINELIRSIIGRIILQELEMPEGVLATVVKVDTAPDLKNADIYFSILPDNKSQSIFKFIEKNKGKLQHLLAKNVSLKFTPKIHCKLDYTEREAAKIDNILDNL